MITRRHFRRWALWAGVAVGAAAALGYLLSFILVIRHETRDEILWIGHGAIITQPNQVFAPAGPAVSWSTDAPGPVSWNWIPRVGTSRTVLPFWVPLAIGVVCVYFLLPAGYGPGRCQQCGYDLAAVSRPSEGPLRCPECGAAAGARS